MSKSLQILDRSYTKFIESIGIKSFDTSLNIQNFSIQFLEKVYPIRVDSYFGIQNYSIHCIRSDEWRFILTIQSKSLDNVFVLNQTKLSRDIVRYIYEFLEHKTKIVSEIIFSLDYPFKHHQCYIKTAYTIKYNPQDGKVCKQNIRSKLALPCTFYNKQLEDSWMTSPNFENHLLCYITHILSLL
jgi:hypothetical protein